MSSQLYPMNSSSFQKLNSRLLYISTSKYEKDWNSIPHTHHFCELFYILGGSGTFILNGQAYPLKTNDLVIVTPNMEHTEESSPDSSPLEYLVLGIDGISFLDYDHSQSHVVHNYGHHKEILYLLNLLLKEAQAVQAESSYICQHLLEILLIYITRQQNLIPTPTSSVQMTKECGAIKRYMDSHYAENINLDFLAAMTHTNKYYLVHAFTKYAGFSPISYLNHKRLQVSKGLLISTNYSISQIAAAVGFSSQSYFAQAFKKNVGFTPVEYRKEYSKQ